MRDCHLWLPPLRRRCSLGPSLLAQNLSQKPLRSTSRTISCSGSTSPLTLLLEASIWHFFHKETWDSASEWITGSRRTSEWRSNTPCHLFWGALNICNGLCCLLRRIYKGPASMGILWCHSVSAEFQYPLNAILRDLLHSYAMYTFMASWCSAPLERYLLTAFSMTCSSAGCADQEKCCFDQQRVEFLG